MAGPQLVMDTMTHGHCPICHHHSLGPVFLQPPDYLTDEQYNAWVEDHEDDYPVGVECSHCGWRDDE